MREIKKAVSSSGEYARVINHIRGVDFSGDPDAISEGRLPIIENMYRNYSSVDGAILESIPGFRRIANFTGKKINALFMQKISDKEEYLLVHAGVDLYRISLDKRDEISAPRSIATLKDSRSTGFSFGDKFYILDGERITCVDKEGAAYTTDDGCVIYTPTTYHNGEPKEQANLLGGEFFEEVTVDDPYKLSYGSPEIKYEIISHKDKLCSVSGLEEGFSGELYIPSYVKIGGELYSVNMIADHAFEGKTDISSLIIANGATEIGRYAFSGCTALSLIVLPNSLKKIGEYAFNGCQLINNLYIGEGLSEIDSATFQNCRSIKNLHYFSDKDKFTAIKNYQGMPYVSIHYLSSYKQIALRIPMTTRTKNVTEVTLDTKGLVFDTEIKNGFIAYVILSCPNVTTISNETVRIRGELEAQTSQYAIHGQDARDLYSGDLINGCTVAQVFDGRIFLSGNPKAPSAIFFSGDKLNGYDGGLYFGALDYITVGSSHYATRAMLAAHETLAVFKSGDGADGGIFYYKRQKLYDKVRTVGYEISYAHNGIHADGDAIAFYDELLFLSRKGLCSLEKNSSGISRNISCKSLKVNSRLLSESISDIRMASWLGYLVLAAGNRMYLLDSRATYSDKNGKGYEWFYLTSIGVSEDDRNVFRFASVPYGTEHTVYHAPDTRVPSELDIYLIPGSESTAMGRSYYTRINEKSYHVYKTEEVYGAGLSPISAIASTEDLLFFGCECGALCVFNNDLISNSPERIISANDDHSDACAEGELHSDHYSFAGVSARYVIGTGNDDLGIPYMAKSTVTGSLVLTVRARDSAALSVYMNDDEIKEGHGAGVGTLNFYDLTFDNLTFDTDVRKKRVFRLRERGFAERDMRVISDRPHSPIGILSLAYRYKICGRIKAR